MAATSQPDNIVPRVRPESFYSSENEKKKFNWFLYELAESFHSVITSGGIIRKLRKKGISDQRIVEFCVYYAKALVPAIEDRLQGKTTGVHLSYKPIEIFFKELDDRLVDRLLTVISQAWDEQLQLCEMCPTRCVSERDVYCTMFDDPDYKI